MSAPSRARSRGFTLVELLVVIGIISVLVALLLPTLIGARAVARRVQCASNLRVIGMSCISYATVQHGDLPNNSYTMGEVPGAISPPPPSGTAGATWAQTRGEFSTSNYQWFDAVAAANGWKGHSTVASRYGAGEQNLFRDATQYLWCPDIDQSQRDPGVFATNYGMSAIVAQMFSLPTTPKPAGTDAYSYDFLQFSKIHRRTEVVFLTEGGFYNYNSEAYNLSNGSLANLLQFGAVKMKPKVNHKGLNYLFFDGHVESQLKPPHSMGLEVGMFITTDRNAYTLTAADDTAFRQVLTRP